jgi:hypothetical protein
VATATRELGRVTKRFVHVWEGVGWHALAVNLLLRLFVAIFTIDALVNAGDERFAGKALGPRNVGILLGLSLLSRCCRRPVGSGSARSRRRRDLHDRLRELPLSGTAEGAEEAIPRQGQVDRGTAGAAVAGRPTLIRSG